MLKNLAKRKAVFVLFQLKIGKTSVDEQKATCFNLSQSFEVVETVMRRVQWMLVAMIF